MSRSYLVALTICFNHFICGSVVGEEPQWIWGTENANKGVVDGICLFQKVFAVDGSPSRAIFRITCDDQYVVRINDRLIGVNEEWQHIEQYDVTSILKPGENRIFVRARNLSAGPAGLLADLKVQFDDGKTVQIITDDTWDASLQKSGTWNPDVAKIKQWTKAIAAGGQLDTDPWKAALTLDDTINVISGGQRSREVFELRDDDRVVFLGNTIIEREQRYGYWEAALTTRFPAKNIVFRNLGWSGDTVFGEARARFGSQREGFDHSEVHVHAVRPSVILCGYGSNAAFQGEAGLDQFIAGYERLLDAIETTGAVIVLMAPLKHEKYRDVYLTPGYNKNRELYREAIKQLATRRNCHFFELPQDKNQPLTDNGVHLTEFGYWVTAHDLCETLGVRNRSEPAIEVDLESNQFEATGTSISGLEITNNSISFTAVADQLPIPTPREIWDEMNAQRVTSVGSAWPSLVVKHVQPGEYALSIDGVDSSETYHAKNQEEVWHLKAWRARDEEQSKKLLQAIRAKNELYFHRWRPQNETYLFLFRKHEQGNNAAEIPMFDPLVSNVEQEIATLRRPEPVRLVLKRKQ